MSEASSTIWELVLNGVKEVPSEEILESLVRRQLAKSTQLTMMMELYNQDVTQRGEPRSYQKLITMTKRILNQQRLERNPNEITGRGGIRDRRSVTPATGSGDGSNVGPRKPKKNNNKGIGRRAHSRGFIIFFIAN